MSINVELYFLKGLWLLVPYPTGVVYTHQCGGHGCRQESVAGCLVPLYDESKPTMEEELEQHFTGPPYNGWCDNGINIDTAKWLNARLNLVKWDAFDMLYVDGTKLAQSCEAFVFLRGIINQSGPLAGIQEMLAILIWPNSD